MGYKRAGFDVTGVDIVDQPKYPFRFIKADALEVPLDGYDLIHASPPCQRYSLLSESDWWPDSVPPIRERLIASGIPYIIENVENAPLRNPITLCGTSFPGVAVIRHRCFESSMPLVGLPCRPHPNVWTHDKRRKHYGTMDQATSFVMVNGGGNATIANKRRAMRIWWMGHREINESIPPAFTHYVGIQARKYLEHAN